MTRGQFDKTSKTNSVIYKCSYCFQTLKQWLQLLIKRFIKLNPGLKWILMRLSYFMNHLCHEDTLSINSFLQDDARQQNRAASTWDLFRSI